MTELLKDQLGRAYLTVLRKHAPSINAIALSERLLEAAELIVDMNVQESGIAALPMDFRDLGEPKDEPRAAPPEVIAPPTPRNAVIQQPDRSKTSMLVLPGDPGFNDSKPEDLGKNKRVVSAPELRRPTRRPSNAPEIPFWSEFELLEMIARETPKELTIDTNDREGRPRRLIVKQDVHNNAGQGTVTLSYKHESVADNDGYLTAKAQFSLYDKEIDISAAMEDLKEQLAGKYSPKPASMAPTESGPEKPLAMLLHEAGENSAGMRDEIREGFQPGYASTADPYGDDQKNVIKAGLRRQNDQLAPAGRRF